MSAWKKKHEERSKSMLERIFNSDFAKEWIQNRQETLKEEVEFYGKERTEEEWKSDLLGEFFSESLEKIVAVLPEVWQDIKEQVKGELDDVLESPETFEQYVGGHTFIEHVEVPFKLSRYLESLEDDLQKTLEAIQKKLA